MLGIAVTKASSGKAIAGIVDHHRPEHNLIASVAVYVSNGKIVEAVTEPRRLGVVAVPAPALCQFVSLLVHIQGAEFVACIAATA